MTVLTCIVLDRVRFAQLAIRHEHHELVIVILFHAPDLTLGLEMETLVTTRIPELATPSAAELERVNPRCSNDVMDGHVKKVILRDTDNHDLATSLAVRLQAPPLRLGERDWFFHALQSGILMARVEVRDGIVKLLDELSAHSVRRGVVFDALNPMMCLPDVAN